MTSQSIILLTSFEKQKTESLIKCLMINRTEVTNETIIANKFNSYFINIAHALVKEIQ